MNKKVILTVVIVLAIIGGLVGVGFAAFRAGTMYGISQSETVAAAIRENPGVGSVMPFGDGPRGFNMPHSFGGWGMRGNFGHMGFGFGFLQCLVPIFGLFLLFAFFRMIFRPWGWRHGWGGHGPWGHGGVPPHFEEWHKQAHGQTPPPPPAAGNPPTTSA